MVEVVNAGASVLTRLVITLVDLPVTQSSSVAGLALAAVVVSTVHAPAVNTSHADAVVSVHFAASTAESYDQPTTSVTACIHSIAVNHSNICIALSTAVVAGSA